MVTGLDREVVVPVPPARPDAPAVTVAGGRMWVYGELWARVDAVAAALAGAGVGPGDRVAIWLPKGADYVVTILATLRLAACYVPLDAAQPAARARSVLADAGPAVLVAAPETVADLPGPVPPVLDPASVDPHGRGPAGREADPEDDAALLYTSGSTGRPKGVRLTHRNVAAFLRWCVEEFGTGRDDRVVNHAPFTFDISLHGLFVPLAVGGSVLVLPDEARTNPLAMADAIRRYRPTVWYSVPSALDLLVREGGDALGSGTSLRTVLFAGEEYPPARLAVLGDLLPPDTVLANLYGPTETNVCAAHVLDRAELDGSTPVPLGHGASGATVTLVDDDGAEVLRPGRLGEIVVTGTCVSPGYWGGSRRRTLDDDGRRRYRTGDVGSYDARGRLRFHGRADRQVQVGGHRVELGEIEAALGQMPGIREAAVERVDAGDRPRLVAAITADGQAPGLLAVKRHCATLVPHYMVPHRVTALEVMPRNANGKIDHGRVVAMIADTDAAVSRR